MNSASADVIEVEDVRYKADITAGALKLPESRLIADLLLRQVDAEGWKDAIMTKNVLQARSPATSRRLTTLIRSRLETMGPELWKLIRDGKGTVAAHAVLAAAVKHSPLLGDFLEIVVAEQYPQYSDALLAGARESFLSGQQWAFGAAAIAVALGAVLVWFCFPDREAERAALARYAAEDGSADAAI